MYMEQASRLRNFTAVLREFNNHGFKSDHMVDRCFRGLGRINVVLKPEHQSQVLDVGNWDSFRTNYALWQWYIFTGMDIHLMIRTVIENYGWCRTSWTCIQQMMIVLVWYPLWLKGKDDRLLTDEQKREAVVQMWSSDHAVLDITGVK